MPTFEPLTTKQTNLALRSTIQTGFIDRRIAATRTGSGSSRARDRCCGRGPGHQRASSKGDSTHLEPPSSLERKEQGMVPSKPYRLGHAPWHNRSLHWGCCSPPRSPPVHGRPGSGPQGCCQPVPSPKSCRKKHCGQLSAFPHPPSGPERRYLVHGANPSCLCRPADPTGTWLRLSAR